MSDSDDFREPHLRQADFLGAFAVMESPTGVLMVQNERTIRGRPTRTWDLPGGQVEPGETLLEALIRELDEELGIRVEASAAEFLFLQEGLRSRGGRRNFAWRSFFFRVGAWRGEPRAQGEVLGARWLAPETFDAHLHAPYHDSFLAWCRDGGTYFTSRWDD